MDWEIWTLSIASLAPQTVESVKIELRYIKRPIDTMTVFNIYFKNINDERNPKMIN